MSLGLSGPLFGPLSLLKAEIKTQYEVPHEHNTVALHELTQVIIHDISLKTYSQSNFPSLKTMIGFGPYR